VNRDRDAGLDADRNAPPQVADGRDRDASGRARNARPRDATGRPLARDAEGIERADEDPPRTPAEALAEGERLLAADQPFAAHDVFEAMWKQQRATGESDTELWQGLAQLAVGLTHLQRDNPTGAQSLLRRAGDNLRLFAAVPPHGIAVARLVDWADRAAYAVSQQRPIPPRPALETPLTR
jgi:hypothetical protein